MDVVANRLCVSYDFHTVVVVDSIGQIDFSRNPAVCFFQKDESRLFDPSVVRKYEDTLIVYVKPKKAPRIGCQDAGEVCSFVSTGSVSRLLASYDGCSPEKLAFHLVKSVIDNDKYYDLRIVHRIGGVSNIKISRQELKPQIVMPHRGSSRHLKASLKSLINQSVGCKISICLDQDETPKWLSGIEKMGGHGCDIIKAIPNPVGPYVARQFLADPVNHDLIVFQDSDDYSIRERVAVLASELADGGADVVGCHELRLDELSNRLGAYRFPLDVNRSLSSCPNHAQLFPTTAVRSAFFSKSGGLSTDRRIANDTHYLFRSSFLGKVINVDEFLYIRRERKGSLTTTPGTEIGCELRESLLNEWTNDFLKVKKGLVTVDNSSLKINRSDEDIQFKSISTI